MLTERQQQSIDSRIQDKGVQTAQQIIDWCKVKLQQPRYKKERIIKTPSRKHGKQYFREIILHFRKQQLQGKESVKYNAACV